MPTRIGMSRSSQRELWPLERHLASSSRWPGGASARDDAAFRFSRRIAAKRTISRARSPSVESERRSTPGRGKGAGQLGLPVGGRFRRIACGSPRSCVSMKICSPVSASSSTSGPRSGTPAPAGRRASPRAPRAAGASFERPSQPGTLMKSETRKRRDLRRMMRRADPGERRGRCAGRGAAAARPAAPG